MRRLRPHDELTEDELPRAVLHEDDGADVAPLVWWWDGLSWHGPPESGDYGAGAATDESLSRS
jgi:hypothetical protein